MAENKPSFLQNIGDDTESQDLLTALDGESENEEIKEEPKSNGDVTEEDTENKVDGDTKVVADNANEEEGEKKDGGDESKDNQDSKDGDKIIEDKSKEDAKVQPESKPKEEPKIFGKYKDITEAEKGYKELESAFGRVNAMLEGYKSGKIPANIPEGSAHLMKMAETPMIKFTKPNAKDYTDADGIMDVDSYMGEFANNIIVGIQKSLLMGPLAAAQFGIIQQAINEESTARITARQKEAEAEDISTKLYTAFPIIKTNPEIEEIISNTIVGAKLMRDNQAKAKGEAAAPFTYEDYEKIITSVLRNNGTVQTPQAEDKVEKIPSGPTLKGNGPGNKDEMDDIIDGMGKVGSKGSIF